MASRVKRLLVLDWSSRTVVAIGLALAGIIGE